MGYIATYNAKTDMDDGLLVSLNSIPVNDLRDVGEAGAGIMAEVESANDNARLSGSRVRYVVYMEGAGERILKYAAEMGYSVPETVSACLSGGFPVDRSTVWTAERALFAEVVRIDGSGERLRIHGEPYAVRDLSVRTWRAIAEDQRHYIDDYLMVNRPQVRDGAEAARYREATADDVSVLIEIERKTAPVIYTNYGRRLRDEWDRDARIIETARRMNEREGANNE